MHSSVPFRSVNTLLSTTTDIQFKLRKCSELTASLFLKDTEIAQ